MGICQLCKQETVTKILDFDLQPICNRFLTNRSEEEYRHPLIAGQCPACGLVQLIDPAPAAELLPVHSWITYNEPEDHLDDLARIITHLPNLSEHSSICGISFKDDSTLERLEKLGLRNTRRLHTEKDLGIREPGTGIETIQDRLTPTVAAQIAREQGTSDVVIARHIVEHSMNLQDFM